MRSSWVSQRWWGHSRSSHFDEVGWRGVCGCCSRVKVIMGLRRRKRGRRGPLLTSCLPCMNDHGVVARTSASTGHHHRVVLTIGYPLGLNDTNGPMAWNQCESVSGQLIKASTLLDHYCVVILHCRVKKRLSICAIHSQYDHVCTPPIQTRTHLSISRERLHLMLEFPIAPAHFPCSSNELMSLLAKVQNSRTHNIPLACAFKHGPFFF